MPHGAGGVGHGHGTHGTHGAHGAHKTHSAGHSGKLGDILKGLGGGRGQGQTTIIIITDGQNLIAIDKEEGGKVGSVGKHHHGHHHGPKHSGHGHHGGGGKK